MTCLRNFAILLLVSVTASSLAADEPAPRQAGEDAAANEAVRELIRQFPGRGAVGDFSTKPMSPADSLATFKVPDDLKIETVLAEPIVRQPLHLSFDERGRMWVVQYIQYPFPAGLKVVKFDEHLRIVFDKVPEPPPRGAKGADKITIHEDTDGDGQFDKHKTFVDGLNIATACARGRGGVWVMNPPYLLFYPDKNDDDVPDGDPEVHLSGFGLEDTHAVANSLTWGPDGWLYGAQGSTCWATVDSAVTKGVHFKGQAIWRYHPTTKVFEIFAEGGGNTFGIEFDAQGRVYSGHNGGDTRGFHFVQGGYYQKGWGKHGALTNPYAFGFFTQMPHAKVDRFSHTFLKYESDYLPERYRGKLFAPVPLHQHIALTEITPRGSTFETKDLEKVVTTTDKWFRPVDIKAGPDGAIYIADWYDTRLTHVDPKDTWDRAHGRIYRISPKTAPLAAPGELPRGSADKLFARLADPNKAVRQTAVRQLYDRPLTNAAPILRKRLRAATGQNAVEMLWALEAAKGFSDPKSEHEALAHVEPQVRLWAVRLLGDRGQIEPELVEHLARLAREEQNVEVRAQLACSLKRLSGSVALPIVWELCLRGDDKDPYIPLLLWWAVESKAVSDRAAVVDRFTSSEAWKIPLIAGTILPRLAERYASDATPENLDALATLLTSAPGDTERKSLVAATLKAFQGRRLGRLPPRLSAALLAATAADAASPVALELRLRAGDAESEAKALEILKNPKESEARRAALAELLGEIGSPTAAKALLDIALSPGPTPVRIAALGSVARFDDDDFGRQLLAALPALANEPALRTAALDALVSRRSWARELLAAVEAKKAPASAVSAANIERLRLFGDAELDAASLRIWGKTRSSPRELTAQLIFVGNLIREGDKNASSLDAARGKVVFTQKCATCHKLFDEGKSIGPDLTGYERDNLDFLLLSVIDPSAFVREEFTNYRVETTGGQVVSGFISERGATTITLVTPDKGPQVIAKDQIAEGPTALPISVMPEKQLDDLSPQQIRDLFAYLRKKAK